MKKIYLAGCISGLSYDEAVNNFESRKERLVGYEVLHPMLGKEYLRTETVLKAGGYSNPISQNHAIFEADRWKVMQADIVWVDLRLGKDRVSIGSMFEMAWANEYHKLVIVTMQADNIHQHAFVKEGASIIFDNEEDVYKYLVAIR